MATESYGVYGRLLTSEGTAAVANTTNVVFIGAAKCLTSDGNWVGKSNEPVYITSEKDYADAFGGAVGDGWSLSEAVEAAFRVCHLEGIWLINVNTEASSNTPTFDSEDAVTAAALIGDASLETGCYAIQKLYPDHGAIANVACIPVIHTGGGKTRDDVLSALKANVTKANGHWDGIMVYDVAEAANQVNASGILDPANVVSAKDLSDERAIANFGRVITSMDNGVVSRAISGAAVKACLYAQTDAVQPGKLPSRSIGNIYVSGCLGVCIAPEGTYSAPIRISEAHATQLSASGIIGWLNKGGGRFYTWGDHTSAFTNGNVDDARARFDSSIRMLYHLTNRFQQVWSDKIDDKLTLAMRDAILAEENEHLAYCVGMGALIGSPVCIFAPDNNSTTAQSGQFYFKDLTTVTPPLKYAELGVAFTSDGFSVYLGEE